MKQAKCRNTNEIIFDMFQNADILEKEEAMKIEKKLTYKEWCRIRRKELKYNISLGAMIVLPPALMILHYLFIGY